jgi:hypothetical protein
MNRRKFFTISAVSGAVSSIALGLGRTAYASDCSRTQTGRVSVNDLGTGTYQGAQGGLYPGGVNDRPATHGQNGQYLANNVVQPRDRQGAVDPVNGRIVFASTGMSNTTQEFSYFIQSVQGDPRLHPKLTIVDGAQGGRDAVDWSDPNSTTWSVLANRLTAAGVTAPQVQVMWLKHQIRGDNLVNFPQDAQHLRDLLRGIVTIARARYPNLRLAFMSSRSYGDYNGEARGTGAYEQAFAVKWLIEDQINGDPRLNHGNSGPAPWLSWGTYLWADGLAGRSDGLTWACGDFVTDGIHPATSGKEKVRGQLLKFLTRDPTATPWFLAG